MLVLSRKVNETIRIGEIEIKIVDIKGNRVRVGVTAPPDLSVDRGEVREAKEAQARVEGQK